MQFCVDGRFVTRGFGGQERFAYEILAKLDEKIEKNEIELVVPLAALNLPDYKNIKIVKHGRFKGLLWEQLDFWNYVRKNDRRSIYLCNTWSLLRPDITAIHDMIVFVMPECFNNFYGRASVLYHKILFKVAARRSQVILTVSEYSKKDIVNILHVNPEKVVVLNNGWQHYLRIVPDNSVFDKFPELEKGKYYLSASSRTPQKNFKWVEKSAAFNPSVMYAIAGKRVGLTVDEDVSLPNLCFLGRVTDEEMKALMMNCKAFIHPAKYEGFGITPLEAMSVNAPIIVSNASCLPEIYRNTAHYIDPDNALVDLDELLAKPVDDSRETLERYSWELGAEKLYNVMRYLRNKKLKESGEFLE